MGKYQNQQTFTIIKKQSTKFYANYGKPEMALACSVLSGTAFKVWCYLLSNNDGVEWAVSPRHAEISWGIPTSSFHDGMKELKAKGFINEIEMTINQVTRFDEYEIRRSKRKPKSYENRIEDSTKFVFTQSEINHSNNMISNKYNENNDRDEDITIAKTPEEKGFRF